MTRRTVLATAGALFAMLAGMAFLPSWTSLIVCAALPAIVAGLIARTPRAAAAASAVGIAVAGIVSLVSGYSGSGSLWTALVVGGGLATLLAAAVSAAVRRDPRRSSVASVFIALTLVCAVMWTAGLQGARSGPLYPFDSQGVARDAANSGLGDYHLYLQTHVLMNEGVPYYEALVRASRSLRPEPVPEATRPGALGFRQPFLYWVWGLGAPTAGLGLPILFLCFGTMAVLGAYVLCATFVRRAFALLGAASVAAFYATLAGTQLMLFQEVWASALLIVSLAFGVRALAAGKGARLTAAAVVFALLAALTREHAALAILAGIVAWWWPGVPRPRRERLMWIAGAVVFGGLFAWHLSATGRPVFGVVTGSGYAFFQASRPLPTLTWGTSLFVGSAAVWLAAALAGTCGPLLVKGRSRLLLAVTVTGIVAVMSSMGPNAAGDPSRVYYWGGLAVPLALACAPLALLRVAEVRRPGR